MEKKKTWSHRELLRESRRRKRAGEPDLPIPDHPRPQTRADCLGGVRPCPYVGCRYHLLLDASHSQSKPGIMSTWGDDPENALFEMPETCALDVADRGGVTLDYVGSCVNITRERVRQVEQRALSKLEDSGDLAMLGYVMGKKARRQLE